MKLISHISISSLLLLYRTSLLFPFLMLFIANTLHISLSFISLYLQYLFLFLKSHFINIKISIKKKKKIMCLLLLCMPPASIHPCMHPSVHSSIHPSTHASTTPSPSNSRVPTQYGSLGRHLATPHHHDINQTREHRVFIFPSAAPTAHAVPTPVFVGRPRIRSNSPNTAGEESRRKILQSYGKSMSFDTEPCEYHKSQFYYKYAVKVRHHTP